ncbi:MAG: ornithine cyclodeaminase family protein [Planctomycetota bacterium]|jgi:ornithine cyclodeaminase/alanine dehydrogenase
MSDELVSISRAAGGRGAATTRFLYLTRTEIERCDLSLGEIERAIAEGVRDKGRGWIESPPKRGIVPRTDSSIRAMMAHVPAMSAAGIKWVSAFPGNARRQLPTISGLIVLNNVETGFIKAVMDATWITAMRTAACSLVAARHFARPDSESVGLIGCGLQGRTHLRALSSRFPVSHAYAYDISHAEARRFSEEMADELGIAVEVVDDPRSAARDADLIVSSTPIRKEPEPTITAGVLPMGSWACALDYDATFTGAAMAESDLLSVDDRDQLEFFREIGYFHDTPRPNRELPSVAARLERGRDNAAQRCLSLHLGIGYLDVIAAELVYRRALQRELGHWLET